jgi:ABC-type transport system substrate-binding protein
MLCGVRAAQTGCHMLPRGLAAAALAVVVVGGCTPTTQAPTPSVRPVAGGTLKLGIWQEPTSFLDAGVVSSLAFAMVTAAPVQEGLLWYRPAAQTMRSTTVADYWAPDLATEVPTLGNGDVKTGGCANTQAEMCVTWRLRPGVRWQDGSSFGAHDVCATYRLYWLKYGIAGTANPTPLYSTAGWDQVIRCTEADRYTAVVDFKSQYGPYLALGSGVYGILPASLLDSAMAQGAGLQTLSVDLDLRRGSANPQAFRGRSGLDRVLDGTGPFVFQSYTPAAQIVLVKNDSYWNAAAHPLLDKLVFVIEPDLASEVRDAESGAIDVAFDLRLPNLHSLQQAAAAGNALLKVQAIAGSGVEKIDFNLCQNDNSLCDNPAVQKSAFTADPTVRRAMLLGIDRQAIVRAVAPGLTSVPRDSSMYLGATYLDDASIPLSGFDRTAADTLLDNAGYSRNARCGSAPNGMAFRQWKEGSCIVIHLGTTSDNATRVVVESMIQSDLQAIGLSMPSPFTPNLKASALLDSFANGGPLYTHAFDTVMYALSLGLPGEPDTLYSTYHGDCGGACPGKSQVPASANLGAGLNVTGVSDAQLDAALDMAHGEADLMLRAHAYIQAEHRLAAILPEIPLFQQLVIDSYSVRMHGLQDNDIVWDFNTADWYCSAGPDGTGLCQAVH